MKTFSCGQVVPGCSATFSATSEAELMGQVASHAHADHGLTDLPPELVASIRSHIVG